MNMRLALTLGWRSVLIGCTLQSLSWSDVMSISAQQVITDWTKPVNFSQQPNTYSENPIILCDKYQNMRALWFEYNQDSRLIYYRDDVSGSWSKPVDVLTARAVQNLTGAITPNDTLHVMWNSAPIGDLEYSQAPLIAAGDAKYWTASRLLAKNVSDISLFTDQAGTLYALYNYTPPSALTHTLTLIQSSDNGQTWTPLNGFLTFTTPVPSYINVMGTVDGNGRIHVAYTTRSYDYAEYSRVTYLRSLDHGTTWSPLLVLSTGGQRPGAARIGVYAFGEDEIHLTWDNPSRQHQWSMDGGVTWSQPATIYQLGAAFGGYNQLVKDSAGVLHVVIAVLDGVYSSTWDGQHWAVPNRIDDRPIDPHRQQIAVCQGNQLHVVYRDGKGDNEIWYSTKQVDAPHIARQPVLQPSATVIPTKVSPSMPAAGSSDFVSTPTGANPTDVILLAAGVVVAFFTAVVLLQKRRRNF